MSARGGNGLENAAVDDQEQRRVLKANAPRPTILIRHNMYIYTRRYTYLDRPGYPLKLQAALSRHMMSYFYIANASLAIGWFQPLPKGHCIRHYIESDYPDSEA